MGNVSLEHSFKRLCTLFFAIFSLLLAFHFSIPVALAEGAQGVGDVVEDFKPIDPKERYSESDVKDHQILRINDELGYGWCIDIGLADPERRPDLFVDAEPRELTHVTPVVTSDIIAMQPERIREALLQLQPLQGQQRDSAIHMIKQMKAAYNSGDLRSVQKYNQALQLLLGTYHLELSERYHLAIAKGVRTPGFFKITNDEFEKASGYRLVVGSHDRAYFEYTGASEIPIEKAAESEYITVVAPRGYDLTRYQRNDAQRIITIDQPGLDVDGEPTPEKTTSEE
ncbi:hypothetical protein MHT86_07320, partial [Corynebacterium mastitidis]